MYIDDFLSEEANSIPGFDFANFTKSATSVVVENNYQVAIMAPTDLLAKQLYRNFKSEYENLGVECSLLVGSLKAKEKKEVLTLIQYLN